MMMTVIFIMLNVDNKTAPLGTCENIEVNNLHAEVKSGDRKNTQVTLMKKNVTIASIKLRKVLALNSLGITPRTPISPEGTDAMGTGVILL